MGKRRGPRCSRATARGLALGLLGVAGVLLAAAAVLWAQDRQRTALPDTGSNVPDVPDVPDVSDVARVCAAAATLLAEQRWLAAHCGGDGGDGSDALTAADVRRALQLAGTLRQADLPAFEAAAARDFCCGEDSGDDGDGSACTVVRDGVWYRSTAARAVLLSWCAAAVAWEHSRRLLALAAGAAALAGALAAVRRRNRARTAAAARAAEAAVRELQRAAAQSARDGSAPYRTEAWLRAAAGAAAADAAADGACWAQALAAVRHTPGVEREQRLLSGRSECVLRWCAPVPPGLL